MPRKACSWTRKLELELVKFVRDREFIWKSAGNTNHHIQQKYKAYAEFAALLGRGYTARSVRDRWVNIRSTFNHNLRKVHRSGMTYKPSWPLWEPLRFLQDGVKKESGFQTCTSYDELPMKKEDFSEIEDVSISIRERGERAHRRTKLIPRTDKCTQVLDDLIKAMKPLVRESHPEQSYWFFGKHITERLNCMREVDANSACRDIMKLLAEWGRNNET